MAADEDGLPLGGIDHGARALFQISRRYDFHFPIIDKIDKMDNVKLARVRRELRLADKSRAGVHSYHSHRTGILRYHSIPSEKRDPFYGSLRHQ